MISDCPWKPVFQKCFIPLFDCVYSRQKDQFLYLESLNKQILDDGYSKLF